jgi:hypothetical protein
VNIYLERGAKHVFASAVEWPGYARIGKADDDAIETLLAYGDRYASAVSSARQGFKAPKNVNVIERVKGGSGTDFGALSVSPKADDRRVTSKELKRQLALLKAAWKTFDAMAETHARKKLATGPRGGGRSIAKMTTHILQADIAYLSSIGARHQGTDMDELREAFLGRLERHWKGEPIENKRKTPPWTVRYCVRRSAWHALDHAWEIEDRAT